MGNNNKEHLKDKINETNAKINEVNQKKQKLLQFESEIRDSYNNFLTLCENQKKHVNDLLNIKNCRTSTKYFEGISNILDDESIMIKKNIYEKTFEDIRDLSFHYTNVINKYNSEISDMKDKVLQIY